jgi:hypothetical protein
MLRFHGPDVPFTGWTVAGILLAMLVGTIHAFVSYVVDDLHVFERSVGGLFPRDWRHL